MRSVLGEPFHLVGNYPPPKNDFAGGGIGDRVSFTKLIYLPQLLRRATCPCRTRNQVFFAIQAVHYRENDRLVTYKVFQVVDRFRKVIIFERYYN